MTARAKKIIRAVEKKQRDFQETYAREINSLPPKALDKIMLEAGIITSGGKLAPRYARAAK